MKFLNQLFFLCFLFPSIYSYAQSLNFGSQTNSHIFRFSDSIETVGIEDALDYNNTRSEYIWGFRASYDHLSNSLIAVDPSDNSKILSYVESINTLTLGSSWLFGKSRNLLAGLTLPFHSVTLTPDGSQITGGGTDTTTTLGDSSLFLKWRLTDKTAKWNIALMPRIILPLGDDQFIVSDGSGFGLRAIVSRQFKSSKWYGHLGFISTPDSGFLNITREQRVEFGIGTHHKIIGDLGFNAEMTGDVSFGGEAGENQNTVNLLAGLRYSINKINLFAGLSVAGILETTAQEIGFYTGLKFGFGSHDKKSRPKRIAQKPAPRRKQQVQPQAIEPLPTKPQVEQEPIVAQTPTTPTVPTKQIIYKSPQTVKDTIQSNYVKVETPQGIVYKQKTAAPIEIYKEVVTDNGVQYKKVILPKVITPRRKKTTPIISRKTNKQIEQEINQPQRIESIPIPKSDDQGKVVKLTNRTLFKFNESKLSDEAKRILAKTAGVIRKYRNRLDRIMIIGHTDTIGSKWYNMYLSKKRAQSVREELIRNGVNPNLVIAIGAGENYPKVYPEKTEADRQKNRRAEFFFKLLFKKKSTQDLP